MTSKNSHLRAKPRNLTTTCTSCDSTIPFIPFSSNTICPACSNMDSPPIKVEKGLLPPTNNDEVGDSSPPPSATSTPKGIKREAEAPADKEPAKKRTLASAYAYADPAKSIFRRTFMHSRPVEPEEVKGDKEESEDEDEFVDAEEKIVSDHEDEVDGEEDEDETVVDENQDEGDEDMESDIEGEEEGPMHRQDRGEDMDDVEGAGDGDEDDLFESTFGTKKQDSDDSDNDSDNDSDIIMTGSKKLTKWKTDFNPSEHTNGCDPIHRPSTPSDDGNDNNNNNNKKAPPKPTAPAGPKPPNPHRDRSPNLRRLMTFHTKSLHLIPRLPLAPHRYWIGVLRPDKSMQNAKAEKDFLWMKGNRYTTVRTVWEMYSQSTAEFEFELLLGTERLGREVVMGELDMFGGRRVFLRAVKKENPESEGRLLTEGLVTTDAVVKGGGGKKSEVIVIEDEDEEE